MYRRDFFYVFGDIMTSALNISATNYIQ